MKSFWVDFQTRRLIIWIILIGLLWAFRNHLKDLAALSWPTIVAASLYSFRTEINALIRRTKRIGREGAEFEAASIAAQIMAQPVEQAMKEVAPGESTAPYIVFRVEAIRNDLNVHAGTDQQRRENLLALRLAQTQQARDYQTIWLNIFSSQIESLARMSLENERVDLSQYFDSHVERVKALPVPPPIPVTFEGWSGYLVRMGLLDLQETRGAITDQGRDFLTFSTQQNLPRFQGL